MSTPTALRQLPGELLPPGLLAACGDGRRVAALMFEQRRCENLAYCRTLTAVYALYRAMYADDEAAFLSQPADYAEVVAARRRLAAQDIAFTAQVSTLLRLGSSAAERVVETAVGMVERLPKVFGLIAEGALSPKAGEAALGRCQVLSDEQALVFDERLHARLTVGDYEVMSLPALREAADAMVSAIDPEAAEKRRRRAEADRTVTFKPEQDGMAAAFVLLTAQEMQALTARTDFIIGTVCDGDPRTVPQRRADGLVALTSGYSTLGCECGSEGCRYRERRGHGEPDADGVITRFVTLITVVVNESTLTEVVAGNSGAVTDPDHASPSGGACACACASASASADTSPSASADTSADTGAAYANDRPGYLLGHGPITAQHARDLAARTDAKIRPFGTPIGDAVTDTAEDATDAAGTADTAPEHTAAESNPRPGLDFAFAWSQIVFHFDRDHETGGPDREGAPDDGPDPDPDDPDPDPDDPDPDPDAEPDPDSDGGPDGSPRGGPSGGPDAGSNGGSDENPDGSRSRSVEDSELTDDPHPQTPAPAETPTPAPLRPPAEPPGRQAARALVRAVGSSGYRPSADLRRYLLLIYPRCVFPFCTRPGGRAQIDHRREYDHQHPELGGQTTAEELQHLCLPHHQLKTAGTWIDTRLSDGRILWTDPHGRRYIVDPSSTILNLFPDLTRIRWTTPQAPSNPGTAGKPRVPGGRTRLQQEHARREQLRRQYAAALEAEQHPQLPPPSDIDDKIAALVGARPTPRPDNEPPPF